MSRPLLLSLLLLVIVVCGGMLLLSAPALEYPISSDPFLPAGTITTWLFLVALPALGWMLQRPGPGEGMAVTSADTPGSAADTDGMPVPRKGFLRRLGTALGITGVLLAFFWPLVSWMLAGNWAFSFGGARQHMHMSFGIFIGYTAFTFLLGVLSILTSFRPRTS